MSAAPLKRPDCRDAVHHKRRGFRTQMSAAPLKLRRPRRRRRAASSFRTQMSAAPLKRPPDAVRRDEAEGFRTQMSAAPLKLLGHRTVRYRADEVSALR